MAKFNRSLESNGLYINSFHSGLFTQRSPVFTPLSALGAQVIKREDTLIGGLNIELSNNSTLVRRPGFPKFSTAQFGSSSYPLAFHGFKNLSGTIKTLVDCPDKVYSFTTSAITAVYTKGAATQTSFQKLGDYLYMVNGTDAKKWDGTTVSGMGITAPATAPTLSFSAGSLSPTSGYKYVYTYRNSATGAVPSGTCSTASPVSASTGIQASKNVAVAYTASSDAQVDKIDIYRTADGGSVFYFLATVTNASSSYTDSTADSGLNNDIVAPTAHSNDPVPSGSSLLTYHMGRLWAASANKVYFAAGPDCTNGNGAEAWPPANVFTFPGKVTALASTTAGLLVFTSSDIFIIYGTSLASFYDTLYQKGLGVQSQNCVAQDGDLLFIYTSSSQLYCFSDTLSEIGFAIGDQLLTNFSPTTSYLALFRNGSDSGLFISDGSTNIYKYRLDQQAWSPVAQVVGGAGAIGAIETSTSNYTLLTGRTTVSGFILGRSTTSWQDSGSSYAANAVIGTLVLAPPGSTTQLESVLIERMPTGTDATVSILLNEISGTPTALPNPVPDPPSLAASTTIIAKRHYVKAAVTPLPQHVRHCQVTVAFATENFKNELLSLCLG